MTQFLEVPTGSVPSREPSCVNGMLRPVLPVPLGHLHGFRFPSLHIKNIIFLLGEPGLEYGGPYSFFPLIIFPFPFLCGDNGFWFYFLFESFYLTKPIIIIYFSFPILRLWSLSLPPNNLRERDLIITGRLRLTEELRDEAWSGRGERVT